MTQPARAPITRLGLQIPSFTYAGVDDADLFERIAAVAVAAEEAGFDSLWVMDHLYQIGMVGREDEPMLEAYTLLGALAARTSRARLGTLVTGVTYRNPALLAKQVTTLDAISSGRAILGIGSAWNEDEHRGYGFAFPPPRERFERLTEAVQIARLMFTEERPSFAGRHYAIDRALAVPRPVTPGGPPIMIGGSGERWTLRLVAERGDACNLFGDVATIRHKLDVLDRHCAEVGRDPAEITKTRLGTAVVTDSPAVARGFVRTFAERRGVSEEAAAGFVWAGTAEQVAEQAAPFLEAGLDGLIVNTLDVHEPGTVERLAGALAPLVR